MLDEVNAALNAPRAALSSAGLNAVGAGMARLGAILTPKPIVSLSDFFRKAWDTLEPGKALRDSWHINFLIEHLEAVSRGQIKRLIINIPPRTLKSTIVSVCWPTWQWTFSPESRIMFISHEIGLALDLAVSRRSIIESDWYREEYPRIVLASDQNEKKLVQNTRRGKFIATSTHGAATGKGGDFIVPDDFIDPELADSDTERESALNAWSVKFSSRLDNKKTGAIIAIEQRTHPYDFTRKLMDIGGYTHIVIPSDNYKKEPIFFSFPSGRIVEIAPGEACMPLTKPLDIVMAERKEKGSRIHDTQERQDPPATGGMIFKPENWRYYSEVPRDIDEMVLSADCAFKGTETSDFVVIQCWGRTGANLWLLDQIRGQMGITGTMAAIISLSQKWPGASRKLIEEAANGAAVIELLKNKVPGLVPIKPLGGKIVRARAIEAYHEAGNIHLPTPSIAPWVDDFIVECSRFPNGSNDDQVDSMTQAVTFLEANTLPKLTII